ncbi:MAG: NADPH-dependent F420 reductase [Chloroflexi bacterium CFX1]|nr:NADPH-dependent F420 reductase [Chloroflexi bacterium CFX1]MDL1920247.1 NADPH-dependent F420 reductase [Chloroflexi bacterium CFX5]
MKDDRILLKIAILGGTGKEGSGLALRWARAGYFVIIGSRSAERADQAAYEINRQLGMDNAQGMDNESACKEADIVVLTVPPEAQIATLEGVREPLAGKILVDATARVDAKDPKPPTGRSAAREAQDLLGPDVKVVAAFQNVPAHALKKLDVELASDVMVCGDDPEARAQTVELAEAAGMKAYEAGGLDNGIVVEGLTALIIAMNKRYKSKVGGIRVSGINKDSEPGR